MRTLFVSYDLSSIDADNHLFFTGLQDLGAVHLRAWQSVLFDQYAPYIRFTTRATCRSSFAVLAFQRPAFHCRWRAFDGVREHSLLQAGEAFSPHRQRSPEELITVRFFSCDNVATSPTNL